MNIIRILFLGLSIFFTHSFYAQNSINDYKYIIVPEGYDFLKKNDAHQLNSLTKFLFNKYNFTAIMQEEGLPSDLQENGCKALKANVKKNSGLFLTKLYVELINCNGLVVYTSKEGTSREKDYKAAYHEALRNAFEDVKALNYKYNKKDISSENVNPVVASEAVSTPVASSDKVTISKKNDDEIAVVSEQKQNKIDNTEVISNATTYTYNEETFLFEKKEFGFELFRINEEKTIVVGKAFKASTKNNYIVKAGDLSGNGHFDAYGNFILERINPVTNKLITDTFARQ